MTKSILTPASDESHATTTIKDVSHDKDGATKMAAPSQLDQDDGIALIQDMAILFSDDILPGNEDAGEFVEKSGDDDQSGAAGCRNPPSNCPSLFILLVYINYCLFN